jgi:protein TonB
MEISSILTADVLDIIFEGRNKDYGAYELRRSYRRRLALSITVMLLVILLLFIGFAFAGKRKAPPAILEITDAHLIDAPVEKPVQLPPPVKPPAAQVQQVKTRQYTNFMIVNEVKPDEKPPEMADLTDARIGVKNINNGPIDDGLIAPPADEGVTKGIIESPKKEDDDANGPLVKVEIESEYPGGAAAWQRYLNRNLRYPQEAIDNTIQGAVVVQFIVDKEGNVSNVEAISGPEELRAEAVRVIKKSGKWTPAIQNGRQVRSYKKQPIVFRLEAE